MFSYQEFYVEQKFSLFIKKLWILDNLVNHERISGKSVLPNGCFNIAVIEGQGLMISHLDWEKHMTAGVYFCGQMSEAIRVDVLPGSKATMIQLYPWVPAHFSAMDMSVYTDQIVPLEVTGFDATVLQGLQGLGSQELYQHFVLRFAPLFKVSMASKLIYQACKSIMDSESMISIAKLAADLGCSVRHLQKLFRKHIGLSPKQFALILKLRAAVDAIAYPEKNTPSLTTLALDNNFYDQAHFTNSFKSMVKTSPNQFHIPDYFLSFKT
ncbi:MAG: AraC family transcriptional regulator [Pedobacter sp.]|nr:MAG: AraC family transcriptional regulator [Pedobacter sp.]